MTVLVESGSSTSPPHLPNPVRPIVVGSPSSTSITIRWCKHKKVDVLNITSTFYGNINVKERVISLFEVDI